MKSLKSIQKSGLPLFVLLFTLFLGACSDGKKNEPTKSMLYTSGGRTSEVLVVISDNLWNSPVGDSIKASLQVVPEWLAVEEPEYIISQIPYAAFGNVYQKQRNILFVKKTDAKKPQIQIKSNHYARPQSYISIKANNAEDLLNTFVKYQNRIKQEFHKNEITRIANAYKGVEVRSLSKKLDQKFGFHLVCPKGFYMASDKVDFAWLRRPTRDVEEGIMIYTTPYTDTLNLSPESIVALRNEHTKKYIPGPVDGSYMKIAEIFPPVITETDFKGNYAVQYRSLWDVEGYPMGGPFISYTFVDTLAGRLITLDGYIKAPKKDKRDLLLHIEAILESFEYAKETQKEN